LATSGDHGEKHEGKHGGIHVFVVEFARVETPFIIALWIFCASLAKIGKGFHKTTSHRKSPVYLQNRERIVQNPKSKLIHSFKGLTDAKELILNVKKFFKTASEFAKNPKRISNDPFQSVDHNKIENDYDVP